MQAAFNLFLSIAQSNYVIWNDFFLYTILSCYQLKKIVEIAVHLADKKMFVLNLIKLMGTQETVKMSLLVLKELICVKGKKLNVKDHSRTLSYTLARIGKQPQNGRIVSEIVKLLEENKIIDSESGFFLELKKN